MGDTTMRELKASTKAGQNIIARAQNNEGSELLDVYGKVSPAKIKAYAECWRMCELTQYAHNFHICSHNTFGFTVAWRGMMDGEEILRYETKDNSYLVWLER